MSRSWPPRSAGPAGRVSHGSIRETGALCPRQLRQNRVGLRSCAENLALALVGVEGFWGEHDGGPEQDVGEVSFQIGRDAAVVHGRERSAQVCTFARTGGDWLSGGPDSE